MDPIFHGQRIVGVVSHKHLGVILHEDTSSGTTFSHIAQNAHARIIILHFNDMLNRIALLKICQTFISPI